MPNYFHHFQLFPWDNLPHCHTLKIQLKYNVRNSDCIDLWWLFLSWLISNTYLHDLFVHWHKPPHSLARSQWHYRGKGMQKVLRFCHKLFRDWKDSYPEKLSLGSYIYHVRGICASELMSPSRTFEEKSSNNAIFMTISPSEMAATLFFFCFLFCDEWFSHSIL